MAYNIDKWDVPEDEKVDSDEDYDMDETEKKDIPDEDIEYDIAEGRHYGYCRGCKQMKHDLSNDDGWCGDCN